MTELHRPIVKHAASRFRPASILVVNRGSSSIRFAVYQVNQTLRPVLAGKVDRVGEKGCQLRLSIPLESEPVNLKPKDSISTQLLEWLELQPIFASVVAVGHRVVHGLNLSEPQLITPALIEVLEGIVVFAPLHLPPELELIEVIALRHRNLPQVACFDTAFHRTMPRIASQLTLPRVYETQGLRRYGFHGLSCEYLLQELQHSHDASATSGRVILAHLGSGASLTAVRNGKSIDNTMGFTPAGGLMMATRSGDIDPGILSYLMRTEQLTALQLDTVINHESGLLGVSETSADIRDLLAVQSSDVRAAEAIDLFCYQVSKSIGAFSAALGGLDTLVFTGGIGENAPIIRARICAGLAFLGIEIEERSNAKNADFISPETGRVAVRVIHADEECIIAAHVCRILSLQNRTPNLPARLEASGLVSRREALL